MHYSSTTRKILLPIEMGETEPPISFAFASNNTFNQFFNKILWSNNENNENIIIIKIQNQFYQSIKRWTVFDGTHNGIVNVLNTLLNNSNVSKGLSQILLHSSSICQTLTASKSVCNGNNLKNLPLYRLESFLLL